jgi:hypothetical protein
MNLTPVRDLAAQISAKHESLQQLLAERQRANDAIAAGEQRDDSIAQLQAQRDNIVGQAFLAKTTADTADIDKAIATAQKKAAATQEAAAAARQALTILAPQIEQAQADLKALQVQQVEAALAQADGDYKAGFDRIAAARDAMVEALSDLSAAATTLARLNAVLKGEHATVQQMSIAAWIANATKLLFPNPTGFGDVVSPASSVAEKARSITAANIDALREAGIDFEAGPLQPKPLQAPTKSAEPRPVSIVTLGDASSDAGPKVSVIGGDEPAVGLVESVVR